MADAADSANVTRMPIPWFDNPEIERDLIMAVRDAEAVARKRGSTSRDLYLFHLQSAADMRGLPVWELYESLIAEGLGRDKTSGDEVLP